MGGAVGWVLDWAVVSQHNRHHFVHAKKNSIDQTVIIVRAYRFIKAIQTTDHAIAIAAQTTNITIVNDALLRGGSSTAGAGVLDDKHKELQLVSLFEK